MTMLQTATRRGPRIDRPRPNSLVLGRRELRPGVNRRTTSRFDDDIWILSPAVHQRHHRNLILDFTTLPAQFREVAKLLFFRLLTGRVSELRVTTIHTHFGQVRFFLKFLDQQGVQTLPVVTPEDIAGFQSKVRRKRISDERKSSYIRSARLLHLPPGGSGLFTTEQCRLLVDPSHGWTHRLDGETSSTRRRRKSRRRENATARIPEQVLSPLLVWALRWTEVFSHDLLALAATRKDNLIQETGPRARSRRSSAKELRVAERLKAVLDDYRQQGRALPGFRGAVNLSHLARETLASRQTFSESADLREMIKDAAADLGIDDRTYLFTTRFTALEDGRPWLDRIAYDDIERTYRLLQSACYIVIAYLSGMRDSEVKHLRRGCLKVWRDEHGTVVRRKITSLAFKGENDPKGVESEWIVTEPVERAIRVLERLHLPHQPFLFATLPTSRWIQRKLAEGESIDRVTVTSHTNDNLQEFARWITEYCRGRGLNEEVPLVSGQEWNLSTSQFRRTLAWFIARRPGGVIAGAIQYRHQRVQMFEGYAGSSDSGFRDEVEAEEAITRGEKLQDIVTHGDHHRLTGPAAQEAEDRLNAFLHQVSFNGKVINDPKRLSRHLSKHDPHVYPGEFVTCVHNRDRALCHRPGTQDQPSLPDCLPLKCRNVALTKENIDSFVDYLQHIDRALARDSVLAPFLRERLKRRRREIAEFIAENTTTIPSPRVSA
ncbi:hypothetical protein [Streptomyces sp. NBC_01506]|uniref:hypothetical protein n=1 Tax=Streptomyces sp. NBC_01506 TaxID=2903887 RepID=UPI0038630923